MKIKNIFRDRKLSAAVSAAAFLSAIAFGAALSEDAPMSIDITAVQQNGIKQDRKTANDSSVRVLAADGKKAGYETGNVQEAANQTADGTQNEDTGKTKNRKRDSGMVHKSRVWLADLTHDGNPETIRIDLTGMQKEGLAEFTVESEDAVLYSDTLSVSHAGWRTYALYQDETGAYLLQYNPYFGQGAGSYSYELFSFDASGRHAQKQGSVSFSAGMPYDAADNDIDALAEFTDEVNALWEHSVLLVTTDQNVLKGLDHKQGTGTEAWEHNYAAPDIQDEPLHYIEQMRWTESISGGSADSADDLRTRLERVNQVLARHRAEAESHREE